MKRLIGLGLLTLFLSACGTSNYHYQSEQNPAKWEGQNIAVVQQKWGMADQTLHTRSGVSYYLYSSTSGRNFFDSTSTNFGLTENGEDFPMRGQFGLKCSAIFKTDKNGIIIGTSHSGSNCGGEWAPGH